VGIEIRGRVLRGLWRGWLGRRSCLLSSREKRRNLGLVESDLLLFLLF
jgi:hypothetical protein